MQQEDIDRVQEFRKCIECFLCQDVCHVLRDHHMHDRFIGPRFLIYVAALEMHPLIPKIGSRNCETPMALVIATSRNVAPRCARKSITITDNAIIPLKERVVDEFYDPLGWIWKGLRKVLNR